ncbi:MAG: pseudouridine synthase, partial [Firmicutes bacterium]|nr:pseudouridine synthase [Bacillota bacterium]
MWIRLELSYDGTDFLGFQYQSHGRTVQGELMRTMEKLLGTGRILGASRTDAGVHAQGQVAVWTGACSVPLHKLAAVLNRRLPPDIRVKAVDDVPEGWDPRRQTALKSYCYRFWIGTAPPLPWSRFVAWMPQGVSWRHLQQTAQMFRGWHDFEAFRSAGSSAKTTWRHIISSEWTIKEQGR